MNTNTTSALRQRSSIEELYKQSQYFTKLHPFQYFSDSLSEFVTILNSNRQIVFCNQPLVNYLKAVDANDIIGKRPGEALRCEHASNATGGCGTTDFCQMCGANRAIKKGQHGEESIQDCRVITMPDTKALDLSVHATPLVYNNEQFTIFSLTDTADEKRRKVLESLFFHDVMNTVGGLMGYSELLKEATWEEAREFAPIISDLVRDLNDQIEAQREISNAEHHETRVAPSVIHSKSLLESIAVSLGRHAVAEGKYIGVAASSEDFMFVSDERLLRRVIGNLTKNALEATAKGSTVTITCSRKNSEVTYSVRNSEVIPHQIQMQIFQRSFSTKGEGRGLGTYSVKLFTEQYLEGSVGFTSNTDDGTLFTVILPMSLSVSEMPAMKKSDAVDLVFA